MTRPVQIQLHRKATIDALTLASKVAPTKDHRQILKSALLTVTQDNRGATIQATNLEQSITVRLSDAFIVNPTDPAEGARVLLPVKETLAALKSMTTEYVTLEDTENPGHQGSSTLTGGPIRRTLSADGCLVDFPAVKRHDPAASGFRVDAIDWARATARTAWAADRSGDSRSMRFALSGVCIQPSPADGYLTWQATNGHVLGSQLVPMVPSAASAKPADFPSKGKPVVPVYLFTLVEAVIGNIPKKERAAAWIDAHWVNGTEELLVVNVAGRAEITTRLMEGRFPNVEDCWPSDPVMTRVIPMTSDFADALRAALPAAKARDKEIGTSNKTLSVTVERTAPGQTGHNGLSGPGVMTLRVGLASAPAFETRIECYVDGPWFEVPINCEYLADMIGSLPAGCDVHFVSRGWKHPIEITYADDFRGMVMPLTAGEPTKEEKEYRAAEDERREAARVGKITEKATRHATEPPSDDKPTDPGPDGTPAVEPPSNAIEPTIAAVEPPSDGADAQPMETTCYGQSGPRVQISRYGGDFVDFVVAGGWTYSRTGDRFWRVGTLAQARETLRVWEEIAARDKDDWRSMRAKYRIHPDDLPPEPAAPEPPSQEVFGSDSPQEVFGESSSVGLAMPPVCGGAPEPAVSPCPALVYDIVQTVKPGARASYRPGRHLIGFRATHADAALTAERFNAACTVDGIRYSVEMHKDTCPHRANYERDGDSADSPECDCASRPPSQEVFGNASEPAHEKGRRPRQKAPARQSTPSRADHSETSLSHNWEPDKADKADRGPEEAAQDRGRVGQTATPADGPSTEPASRLAGEALGPPADPFDVQRFDVASGEALDGLGTFQAMAVGVRFGKGAGFGGKPADGTRVPEVGTRVPEKRNARANDPEPTADPDPEPDPEPVCCDPVAPDACAGCRSHGVDVVRLDGPDEASDDELPDTVPMPSWTRPEFETPRCYCSSLVSGRCDFCTGLRQAPTPEPEPAPRERIDRDEAIKRIRTALKKRSGKSWSVTGGRGTAWGWIEIDAPPKRRTWHYVDTGRKDDYGRAIHEEAEIVEKDFGHTSPADRAELGELLGLGRPSNPGGESVAASADHRWEYIDRAEGREPRVIGQQYWD